MEKKINCEMPPSITLTTSLGQPGHRQVQNPEQEYNKICDTLESKRLNTAVSVLNDCDASLKDKDIQLSC